MDKQEMDKLRLEVQDIWGNIREHFLGKSGLAAISTSFFILDTVFNTKMPNDQIWTIIDAQLETLKHRHPRKKPDKKVKKKESTGAPL